MNWKGGKRSQINRESNTHVAAESQTILYWANIVLITNIYAHYRITWKKIFRRCVKGSVLMINRTLSGRKQIVNRLTTHTHSYHCALYLSRSRMLLCQTLESNALAEPNNRANNSLKWKWCSDIAERKSRLAKKPEPQLYSEINNLRKMINCKMLLITVFAIGFDVPNCTQNHWWNE